MAKRKKIRYDRLFLMILCLLVIGALLIFSVGKLISFIGGLVPSGSQPQPVVDPEPVATSENVKIELVDYTVYRDDSDAFDFDFIIATMRFSADQPVSFDLSNLQTSEKIHLNKVAEYINQLEAHSYDLKEFKIVDAVVSKEQVCTCNIFIPFMTDSSSLRVLNALDASSMLDFDLYKNVKNITSLVMDDELPIEVGDTNVRVSSSSVSTMMLHNGEEYQIPSTLNVYTFRIYVEKTSGDVSITDARFVNEKMEEPLQCMSEEYSSVKVSNCLNKTLTAGENGALFFEASNTGDAPDYSGHLMLKFSNESDWVKIPTVLE